MKQSMTEYIGLIGTFVARIFSYITFKTFFATIFVILSFLFDPLRTDAMIAILVLIIIDFMTAIMAVMKTGEEIKSRKILYSAFKTSIYFMLIAAAYVAEQAIPIGIIDETVMAFLAATELISVLENVSKAGYAIPRVLLQTLKEFSNKK